MNGLVPSEVCGPMTNPADVSGPGSGRRLGIVLALVGLLILGLVGSAAAGALITGRKIKDGSLLGRDFRNESLTGADVRGGSLRAVDIVAPAGADGGPGGPGPQGPHGAKTRSIRTQPFQVPGLEASTLTVMCDAGTRAVSGGVYSDAAGFVHGSKQLPGGVGWQVTYVNSDPNDFTVSVLAVCIDDPATDPALRGRGR